MLVTSFLVFFSVNDPPTPQIYTLSLHDALPISPDHRNFPRSRNTRGRPPVPGGRRQRPRRTVSSTLETVRDRKSTRLNSSHVRISYAVFCLKKKKTKPTISRPQHTHDTRSRHDR